MLSLVVYVFVGAINDFLFNTTMVLIVDGSPKIRCAIGDRNRYSACFKVFDYINSIEIEG